MLTAVPQIGKSSAAFDSKFSHQLSHFSIYYSVNLELRDKIREDERASDRQGEKLARMPRKKYIVTLTDQERSSLEELTRKGKAAAYKVNHARMKAVS